MCSSPVIEDTQLSFAPTLTIALIVLSLGGLGFLFKMLIFNSIQSQKKEIREIDSILTFYAWAIASPNHPDLGKNKTVAFDERSKAGDIIRKHSTDLEAITKSIPMYDCLPKKYVIESKDIFKACGILLRLSNSVVTGHSSENKDDTSAIRKLLEIEK